MLSIKCLLLFLFFGISSALIAQTKAITEEGEEVVLYNDGTWKALNKENLKESVIKNNPKKYKRSKDANFNLKSQNTDMVFALNTQEWKFSKATNNEDAEYEFSYKDGDLYGMAITEKIAIPMETLKEIAVENARDIAPDLTLVTQEYRTVNGLKVLHTEMHGTMKGIKFAYFGYYYSGEQGSVQFVVFTSQDLMKEYKGAAEKFLNGLMTSKK